jgi:hypothetical protein
MVILPKVYCISLPRYTALWTSIVFMPVLFRFRISFRLRWKAKSSNVFASSFAWSSVYKLPKHWNVFWGFWRTFFKPDSGFSMTFTFQGRWSVSWRWRKFRATKHQQNNKKYCKIRLLIHEDRRRTIHELTDTTVISYGVCQILSENLNMSHTASSSRQGTRPHVLENHRVCN